MAEKDTTTGYELSSNAIQSYLDAKTAQRNISTNWDTASDLSGQLLGAVQDTQEAKRVDEENKRKELESHEEQFSNNVLKITENSGSLGEEYYGVATEQAKMLQGEYMEAVRSGDKEAQTKIKMKLQGLSTGVGSLKESLSIAAELKNDGALSNGRTAEEIKIADVCTNPANAVYQDGKWLFKDPNTGQMYTQEDLDKSLGQIDEVTSKAYLDYEMSQNESGMNYVNGTGPDFDFNRIKTSIGDNFIKEDNIMSIMHDDFRKSGESNTFKNDLSGYLEQMPDYYKTFNIDVDGDGIPGNSEEDKAALVKAVTDKTDTNYDFKMSKNIVADYLARQSEEKFYGSHPSGKSAKERKAMKPEPGETEKTFIARGGIMGELAKEGTIWNEDLGKFITRQTDKTGDELLKDLDK
tara:strand:- start:9770 stop:10996 length:1227 start_codon:yes stop_codon:yes gene_type:complete